MRALHECPQNQISLRGRLRQPPRHTRFRKGRSGNQYGRPPRDRARRLKALTLQEAYRVTAVKEDGRMVPVTSMEAILRSQVELAAKGNVQAQRAILAAVRRFEEENEWEEMLAEIRRGREVGTGAHEPNPTRRNGKGRNGKGRNGTGRNERSGEDWR